MDFENIEMISKVKQLLLSEKSKKQIFSEVITIIAPLEPEGRGEKGGGD